jgi:class I fructose-bisphosphate aldolase
LLTYPSIYDQTLFASVQQAFDLGAVAVGATVYYGSPESRRQIQEVSAAFAYAHELGMVTFLWAYLRNPAFKHEGVDYHAAADLTGQANHLAATIEADIVKQKQAQSNGGYTAIKFGRTHPKVYSELTSDHPIDLVRYQVANCYMGRVGLINSGGASGENDLAQAVRTAVINKQQAGWRHGPHLRAQGVPEADGRGRQIAQRHSRCVSVGRGDHRLKGFEIE